MVLTKSSIYKINLQYQRSKKMKKFRYTAFLMNHDDIVNTTFVNLNLYNDALINFYFLPFSISGSLILSKV